MMSFTRFRFSRLNILVGLLASPAIVAGNDADDAGTDQTTTEITPADVFVRVALVRTELKLIRRKTGQPADDRLEITVTNAAPREVYYQALTLFHKADRLCFEQVRQRTKLPKHPGAAIKPKHVFAVVDAAIQRVRLVKTKLGIIERSHAIPRDVSKQPSDVFLAIVRANQELNLLLEQPFAPGEVFFQVTTAIGYTSRLLAQFPGSLRLPDPPAFEAGRQPPDVYRRLQACLRHIEQIAKRSGVEVLELATTESEIQKATPSDVYDLASLLVSELAHLHAQIDGIRAPYKAYPPGEKSPAHVYQRAGMLKSQLAELETLVKACPTWLRETETQND